MSKSSMLALGISQDGIDTAFSIKQSYKRRQPLIIPGEKDRLLVPETLLNADIDLSGMDDPLALAMVSNRDPESPMALAAAARLSPAGAKNELLNGVVRIIGETSRHELVRECLKYVTDRAFEPESIGRIHQHASKLVIESRQQFTAALRDNLKGLLDGELAPRAFVRDFFELTEVGNMRHDIRKKLVLSLLLSSSVRPSIKFLMLENFHRMPKTVRHGIIAAVLKAEPNRHTEVIKEELKYIVLQERAAREQSDINGRPSPSDAKSREQEKMLDPYATSFPCPMPGELHPARPRPGLATA